MTNEEKLKRAAELVFEVMGTLDTATGLCDHCGVTKYDNRSEAQLHLEMEAVHRKLLKWAARKAKYQHELRQNN